MGNDLSSTIDVSKDVLTKTITNLESNGNISESSQLVNIEGGVINNNGTNCPEGSVINIGNYSNISSDAIMSATADAFADVVLDLTADLENEIPSSWIPGATSTTVTKDKTTIKNIVENHLKSTCNSTKVQQITQLSDVIVNNTCGELNIQNMNVQSLSCASDAIANATQNIEAHVSTTASNQTNTYYYIFIGIIFILFFIMVVLLLSGKFVFGFILFVIFLLLSALGFQLFYNS